MIRTWPDIERRRYPRVSVHLPAVCQSARRTMDGYVSNLSQGGLSLVCAKGLEQGSAVTVQLTFPGHKQALDFRMQVVWEHAEQRSIPAAFGLRFEELSRDERVALANFLIARFYCS